MTTQIWIFEIEKPRIRVFVLCVEIGQSIPEAVMEYILCAYLGGGTVEHISHYFEVLPTISTQKKCCLPVEPVSKPEPTHSVASPMCIAEATEAPLKNHKYPGNLSPVWF